MIGRFLLGSGLGALVGTGLLAIVSIVSPAPPVALKATGTTPPAEAGAPSTPDPVADPAPAASPAPEAAPEPAADPAPVVSPEEEEAAADPGAGAAAPTVADAPAPDAVTEAPALSAADSDPAAAPQAPAATEAPVVVAGPEAPAKPAVENAPAAVPVPAAAPDVAVSTAPPAPEATGTAADPALAALPGDQAAPASPADPMQPGPIVPEPAPSLTDLPGPPPLTPEEEALLRELAEGSPGNSGIGGPVPGNDGLPGARADADGAAGSEAGEEPGSTGTALAPTPTEGVELIETDPALPSAAAPPEAPEGVTTDRLPRIGAEPAPEPVAADAAQDSPLGRYARAFENAESKPAFAIVLIDDGSESLDRAALAALPFAVSFALDPTHPGVADHAAIYRSAGQEVVMLASALPEGAQAADVEVALAAMAQALPESVAVMDMPQPAFQSNRPLATMVVSVVSAQGRGLLTWDQGLNAADQVARREDVPAAVAFRDLDGQGETAAVIRRYLDRAAFKAAQEGRVTVIGRARPETVAAILEWTVEGRAATVALAPLSAVLSVD